MSTQISTGISSGPDLQIGCLSDVSAQGFLQEVPYELWETDQAIQRVELSIKHIFADKEEIVSWAQQPHCQCLSDEALEGLGSSVYCDDEFANGRMLAIRL